MELELRGISKSFAGFQAVTAISFGIEKGELFSMVGPSGCGKTTILRLISGFLTPDEGKIILGDQDITFAPINKRPTALVFQNYALFPHLSVFDNIAFGLRMHKVPRQDIKPLVKEALDLIRLPESEEKYPSQLSGGQQQRVALARALVIRPQILLLDEPLSNLDAKLRESLRIEIREIQKKVGITSIFVTHDISEAFAMSDRIAVLNSGLIEQVGTPVTIYESPRTEFVASFVGKSNQVLGVVESVGDGVAWARVTNSMLISFSHDNDGRIKEHQKVRLMIRPERISLVRTPTKGVNSFPGVVNMAVYLGSEVHYEVDIAGYTFIIETQNHKNPLHFSHGDRVFVEWGDDDCSWYSHTHD